MINNYSYRKKEVIKGLEIIHSHAQDTGKVFLASYIDDVRKKLVRNGFNLVVLGEFKRGKTTFINSLLGSEILPSAVVPLTSIVTLVQYGHRIKCEVVFLDGRKQEISLSDVSLYATEEGNPQNEKKVKLVQLEYPCEYLKEGILLIDTPGVGSIYQNNTDETYNYLPSVDAAIFLLSSDQPVSRAECDFLQKVKQYSAKTFFILNKIDYLGEEDKRKALDFTKKVIEEQAEFAKVDITPLSAKMALEGKLENNNKKLADSNLPRFIEKLERFLLTEKGLTALKAACYKGINAIGEMTMGMELETRALMIPLEDLQAKIGLFDEMVENLTQEQQDNKYIFQGEMKKVYRQLEEEISAFQERQNSLIEKKLEKVFQEKKTIPSPRLLKFLRSYINSSIEEAFNDWQPQVEEKVKAAFEKVESRFTDKTNRITGELLRQSAEIFDISIEGFTRLDSITEESKLYYIIGEQPPLLLPESIKVSALFLPGFIAKPMILREMKKKIEIELDRNCGRVRTDYSDRIEKSARMFQKNFENKFSQVVEGTRTVLSRAMEKRRMNEKEVADILNKLEKQKKIINEVKNHLLTVIHSIEKDEQELGLGA
ncbi:MAG: dynamin family protein [Bacillota bacterium]